MVPKQIRIVMFILALASCSSRPPQNEPPATPAEPSTALPTLKGVMESGVSAYFDLGDAAELVASYQVFKTAYESKGLLSARMAVCEAHPQGALCRILNDENAAGPRSRRAQTSAGPTRSQVRRRLETGAFDELRDLKPTSIIAGAKLLNEAKLRVVSERALAAETCLASATYSGLAHATEVHFPEPSAIDRAVQLFRKATDCGQDEDALRAAYRLALLKTWQGACQESKALWERILARAEAQAFHSRAAFWAAQCVDGASASPEARVTAASLYQSYPLSFHAIALAQKQSDDLFLHVLRNPEPAIRFRTEGSDEINDRVRLAEIMITDKKESLAALVLKGLRPEVVAAREPEFALYVSYLFYRAQMGLWVIQTLAPLFAQNPKLKTPTTLQLFFPRWHGEMIADAASKEGLDPYLIMALIRQESGFNERAMSRAKARGLMQLLWVTARVFESSRRPADLFQPEINVRIGVKFLAQLIRRYEGDIPLALAAYNAGPLVVDAWRTRYPIKDSLLFVDIMPFKETREYVAAILRNWYWYRAIHQAQSHPGLTLGQTGAR